MWEKGQMYPKFAVNDFVLIFNRLMPSLIQIHNQSIWYEAQEKMKGPANGWCCPVLIWGYFLIGHPAAENFIHGS